MQHLQVWGEMKSPGQKTDGVAKRFAKILMAVFVAVFIFAPKPAHAAPSLADLLAALSGSPGAFETDIGYPFAVPFDPTALTGTVFPGSVNGFDINTILFGPTGIAQTLGKYVNPLCDTGFPNPSCLSVATATVSGAMSGNATDLSALQNSISGSFWQTYITNNPIWVDTCGFGCWTPYYFPGAIPPTLSGFGPNLNGLFLPNPISAGMSWMLAGSGNQATQTLIAAMGCSGSVDAGAVDTLNTLFYNPTYIPSIPALLGGGSSNTYTTAMLGALGGAPPPSLAMACATLNLALTGDVTANSAINLAIASILNINQILPPPTYNATGVAYLMVVPVTPTGLTGSPPSILVNPPVPPPPVGPVPIPPPPVPIPVPVPPTPPAPALPGAPPVTPVPPAAPVPGPVPTPPTVGQSLPTEQAAPTNGCGSGNPALTGSFGYNNSGPGGPICGETEGLLQMTNDTTYWDVAGTQFIKHINDWFDNQMVPAMRDMTAQLSSSVIDQSRQMGTAMDSHNMSKNARMLQDSELEEKQRLQPNEHSCVPASSVHAQAQTMTSANALSAGYHYMGNQRTGNAPGQPGANNPEADQQQRWKEFCTYFLDTQSNAGWNECPGNAPSAPQPLVNGDIDIEGVLLVDTIDLNKKEQYHAVQAIMQNLVQPRVWEVLPDSVVETPAGQQQLLQREHIKAIQNIAYDVIGGIISRRASIPMGANDVSAKIKEIRERASVDPNRISNAANASPTGAKEPSYNEIMLALTKERFFDPDYYTRMANDIGALKQEQTSINAYATITLQDIYKLQEQINALLAARAAMKFEKEPASPSEKVVPTR